MAVMLNVYTLKSPNILHCLPLSCSTVKNPQLFMASTALFSSTSQKIKSIKKKVSVQLGERTTHSMPREKLEIFKSMEHWAEKNVLLNLKPVEECWQPQDLLPDSASDGFLDEVEELKDMAKDIPDELLVALVGNMITEEALPTYQTALNSLDGVGDETGASQTPWATWIRAWTAEEARHGDLLSMYLYLSGRVDMKAIEKTIQYLVGSGMDFPAENNPYLGFIYTSFQERATFLSHGSTARLAKKYGNTKLAKICGTIGSDEKRHEHAYTKIVKKLFEIDPDYTVLAFATMMRKKITMPAHWMYDGRDYHNLFAHFSAITQRLGVYTAEDYVNIMEHLVKTWNVEKLTGLSSEGRKGQEFVCGLPAKWRKLMERGQRMGNQLPPTRFSWIFDRVL